jgi:molybdate transport system substrate-binding protein
VIRSGAALLLAALIAAPLPAAAPVAVAAAANLAPVLGPLEAAFRAARPAVQLTLTVGASGSLHAQIRQGAPFDVLLAADVDYPRALVAAGDADPATFRVFARGRLVFWTLRGPLAGDDLRAALSGRPWATLALAQPRTAPYGRAAEAVLRELGFPPDAGTRLVLGETVAQAAQFVESGAAEAGFVALAAVLSPRLAGRGHWREVPADLHPGVVLDHAAVLTRRGVARGEARAFLDFLDGPEARSILHRFGYATPAAPAAP